MNATGNWSSDVYTRLIAAIAVPRRAARQFELLCGVDPDTGHLLTEVDEVDYYEPWLRYCRRDELPTVPGLARWLDEFPCLLDTVDTVDKTRLPLDLGGRLLANLLDEVRVLRLAYGFIDWSDLPASPASHAVYAEMKASQLAMSDDAGLLAEAGKDLMYTMTFETGCVAADRLEAVGGLTPRLRHRLGLDGLEPGLLLNYMRARNARIEDLLDWRQFESFVAALFEAEGWAVTLTREGGDGGKDVVAERDGGDAPELVYVQAKRNAPHRPVTLKDIKAFTATIATSEEQVSSGDVRRVDRGIVVTTSHVSRPGQSWARGAGASLAQVDFMCGAELVERIAALTRHTPRVFEVKPSQLVTRPVSRR